MPYRLIKHAVGRESRRKRFLGLFLHVNDSSGQKESVTHDEIKTNNNNNKQSHVRLCVNLLWLALWWIRCVELVIQARRVAQEYMVSCSHCGGTERICYSVQITLVLMSVHNRRSGTFHLQTSCTFNQIWIDLIWNNKDILNQTSWKFSPLWCWLWWCRCRLCPAS